jgi:hypothetical protein
MTILRLVEKSLCVEHVNSNYELILQTEERDVGVVHK